MEEIFRKVFEKVSKLSDAEFHAKLAEVSDHPLVTVFAAIRAACSLTVVWNSHDQFGFAQSLIGQQLRLRFDELQLDDLTAANDEQFYLAA
ncbi:hypothetical protein [Roseateles flavus]|uniref:Uncharacterized protein n=1 Tax=Roseateles flavus TaxID=3149041 RepID=A0ABV0GBF5_9BURK